MVEGRAGLATVSLSRSGGVAVAAAVEGRHQVGVDIEWADARPQGLARVVLARGEDLPSGDDGPLRLWTRKEAVLKATGAGLTVDPQGVRIDGLTVVAGPAGPWWLADIDLAPGLIGSVAVRAHDARIAAVARLDTSLRR